jgi:hypothetical protein
MVKSATIWYYAFLRHELGDVFHVSRYSCSLSLSLYPLLLHSQGRKCQARIRAPFSVSSTDWRKWCDWVSCVTAGYRPRTPPLHPTAWGHLGIYRLRSIYGQYTIHPDTVLIKDTALTGTVFNAESRFRSVWMLCVCVCDWARVI